MSVTGDYSETSSAAGDAPPRALPRHAGPAAVRPEERPRPGVPALCQPATRSALRGSRVPPRAHTQRGDARQRDLHVRRRGPPRFGRAVRSRRGLRHGVVARRLRARFGRRSTRPPPGWRIESRASGSTTSSTRSRFRRSTLRCSSACTGREKSATRGFWSRSASESSAVSPTSPISSTTSSSATVVGRPDHRRPCPPRCCCSRPTTACCASRSSCSVRCGCSSPPTPRCSSFAPQS